MEKFDFQKLATALKDIPMLDVSTIYIWSADKIEVAMAREKFEAAFDDYEINASSHDQAELATTINGVKFFCFATYKDITPRQLEPLK